jgi:hypothetical protein
MPLCVEDQFVEVSNVSQVMLSVMILERFA